MIATPYLPRWLKPLDHFACPLGIAMPAALTPLRSMSALRQAIRAATR
jgi:hypothetical protein